MKEVPNTITTLIAGVAITLASIWYGQNHGLLPAVASAQAPQIDRLFNAMMSISTGLFLIIQGALVVSLFRFRQRKGDNTDAAPVHGNIPLEILWTAIPAGIVLWLAIYSFDVYTSLSIVAAYKQWVIWPMLSPSKLQPGQMLPLLPLASSRRDSPSFTNPQPAAAGCSDARSGHGKKAEMIKYPSVVKLLVPG